MNRSTGLKRIGRRVLATFVAVLLVCGMATVAFASGEIVGSSYEAAIGEDNYVTLADALDAADGKTVTLLKDITYTGTTGWEIKNKNVTLDLNGKTISATASEKKHSYIFQVAGGGALTVNDTAGGGGMNMLWEEPDPAYGAGNYVFYNNGGELTVNEGTFVNKTTGSGAYYVITNWTGTTTINGGTLDNSTGTATAVRLYCGGSNSKIVVNGGEITGGYFGVQVQNNGTNPGELIINGGTIATTDDRYELAVYATGANTKVTIDGGDFKNDVAFGENVPTESIAVNDGLFEGDYGVYSYLWDEEADEAIPVPFVHGGIFTGEYASDVYDYYLAEDVGYDVMADGTVVVGDFETVPVTVTPDELEKYVGDDDPELTYTVSDEDAEGIVSAVLKRAEGEATGTYAITADKLTGGFNADRTIYYDPVLSEETVYFTILDIYQELDLPASNGAAVSGENIHHDAKLVVADVSGTAKTTLEQKAEEAGQELIFSKDVSLVTEDGSVPFTGTLDVTLEVGSAYSGREITVLHLKDGECETFTETVEDGKVTVTVNSLSPFGGLLPPAKVERLKGKTRTETAAKISAAIYPDSPSTNVIIASGDNYADALAGVPLANRYMAPILLVQKNSGIDQTTLDEISRLKAENVIILGGTGAVPDSVDATLKDKGLNVKRVYGASRYDTAVKIAEDMYAGAPAGVGPSRVYFVFAENYPDALSVSSIAARQAAPILYINGKGTLDTATKAYLEGFTNKPEAVIIGGTGVISADAETNLKPYINGEVKRLYGKDRYKTCLSIVEDYAKSGSFNPAMLCVATGESFPDALAGGVYCLVTGSPMILVPKTISGEDDANITAQIEYIKNYAPGNVYIFGGDAAVSTDIENLIAETIG